MLCVWVANRSGLTDIVHEAEATKLVLESPIEGKLLYATIGEEVDGGKVAGALVAVECFNAEEIALVGIKGSECDVVGSGVFKFRPVDVGGLLVLVGIAGDLCVGLLPCQLRGRLFGKVCGCQILGCSVGRCYLDAEVIDVKVAYTVGVVSDGYGDAILGQDNLVHFPLLIVAVNCFFPCE